jgi:hypothetical protein
MTGSEVDTFRDDASKKGAGQFNWTACGVGFGAMFVIFGVIIGLLVSTNSKLDTSDPATVAPASTTTTTDAPVVDTDVTSSSCDVMTKNFTWSGLKLTFRTRSTISGLEVDYAAGVFEKTYGAMLENELVQAQADYCDPYCRKIVDVNVESTSLVPTSVQVRQTDSDGCDAQLVLVFGVEGTYQGCEGTEFPGLFSADAGRRALQQKHLRFLDRRRLDSDGCPVCPDDVTSLGLVSPSMTQFQDTMAEFVTVLPTICSLDGAEIVAP